MASLIKRNFESIVKERKTYVNHCLYQVELQDKRNQKNNKKEFVRKGYFVAWDGSSYGIDNDPSYAYLFINKTGGRKSYRVIDSWRSKGLGPGSTVEKIEKPFFSLKKDIYEGQAGYLKLNFFDMIDDSFFQIEGHKLNQMGLKCQGIHNKNKKGNVFPVEVFWPYNVKNNHPVSVKALFLHPDMRRYFGPETLASCRVMFYEDKILRYFSKEMKVIY